MGWPSTMIGVYIDMMSCPEAGLVMIPVLNTPLAAEVMEF